MTNRARNVVFTQFLPDNYQPGEEPTLLDPSTWKDCSYCIYQLEICPKTGRLHYQGYLECVGQKTWDFMHNNWEGIPTARFAARKGSAIEAANYCKKGESALDGPWEWGEMKEQGKRSDLAVIKRKIDELVPINELYDDHFGSMMRYKKQFIEYRRVTTKARDKKTQCWLFVGPPGQGKSTMMRILAHMLGRVYFQPFKKGSGLYFDDYDGEDVMIIDEFDGDVMPPKMFNAVADEHPCVLPVHGGAGHQMVSKYLFIASNYAPRFWWRKRNASQLRQTTRRIDVTFKMGFTANPNPPGFSRQLNIV